MSDTIHLHVGSLEDMGRRFASAWQRLEHGEYVDETHLTFFDLETLLATLSPERLALLRHIHRYPSATIADLTQALGRDEDALRNDLTALDQRGLVTWDGTKQIRVPYDHIQASVSLV